MEARFYHLTRQSLEQALPSLLEKTLQRGWKAVVRLPEKERMESLDGWLWTYRDDSFLPHGLDNGENQPVYLTLDDERPNNAEVLFLCDGLTETAHPFELLCLVFSGADEAATANARAAWAKLKDSGATLTYWQQSDKGWEKKA